MGRTRGTSKPIGNAEKKAKQESVLWRMFTVTVLMVFVAIGMQYYYHNYIYLPGLITKKTDLPKLELNLDVVSLVWHVCGFFFFCNLFCLLVFPMNYIYCIVLLC